MSRETIKVNKKEDYDGTFKGLEKIVDNYIRPNYKDIQFYLKDSITTNSYYIYMYKNDCEIVIRFSDHKPVRNMPSYTLKSLRKACRVVACIICGINRLNRKVMYETLRSLGDKKC